MTEVLIRELLGENETEQDVKMKAEIEVLHPLANKVLELTVNPQKPSKRPAKASFSQLRNPVL